MSDVHPVQTQQKSSHWLLDPDITYLNHGSFGARLRAVFEAQQALRARIELDPIQFFIRDYEGLLDAARKDIGVFLDADPNDLACVSNATMGVNTVLRSLVFNPGDELVTTNHEYNACRNALNVTAEKAGARVVIADIPFPIHSADQVVDTVLGCLTPRTRLVLIDHITSQTGLILPIEELLREIQGRGIDVLVDGAHAPGMVPLSLRRLNAAYYTGNCHKWVCAPLGAAFLYVRKDKQKAIRPLSISHGTNSPRVDRSRYLLEFDWTGTMDPSPFLCIPEAIRVMATLMPGGWEAIQAHNRKLALAARSLLCDALGCAIPSPDSMIGSLAAMPLPDGSTELTQTPLSTDPLQDALFEKHRIEVPVIPWPQSPKRLLRISAQVYNQLSDYERLATALKEL